MAVTTLKPGDVVGYHERNHLGATSTWYLWPNIQRFSTEHPSMPSCRMRMDGEVEMIRADVGALVVAVERQRHEHGRTDVALLVLIEGRLRWMWHDPLLTSVTG